VTLEPDDLGRDFEPRIVVELVEVED